MECPDIRNLKLDKEDLEALEEIRRVQRAGNLLEVIMPAGVFTTIFLGSNSVQANYQILSTEWVEFAKAMNALPRITRGRISQVAQLRIATGALNNEQRQFWSAVDSGCGGY